MLTDEEKELGVCLVDIGGGTTDIAIFQNGAIVHTAVIALGGHNLTNDIAVGLRTPIDHAERLKQKYGCSLTAMVDKADMIEVPSVGGRDPRVMGRQILSEILEPRVEEIFQLVHHEVERNGFSELLTSGVVITGGSTLLPGMTELAEEIMGVPVRRGVPRGIGGLVDVVTQPRLRHRRRPGRLRRPAPGPQHVPHPRRERLQEGEAPHGRVASGSLLKSITLATTT